MLFLLSVPTVSGNRDNSSSAVTRKRLNVRDLRPSTVRG